jgi:hypothetical protein
MAQYQASLFRSPLPPSSQQPSTTSILHQKTFTLLHLCCYLFGKLYPFLMFLYSPESAHVFFLPFRAKCEELTFRVDASLLQAFGLTRTVAADLVSNG